MAVIPLGATLPLRSCHLPADSASSLCESSAYLVLLRMEVAAFHPPSVTERRLVSVALFLAFAAVFERRLIRGRALPGILLCGARTFLYPRSRDSDGLAGFGLRFYATDSLRARFGADSRSCDPPGHGFSRAQRNERVVTEGIFVGARPRLAHERDRFLVARKAVEVRAEAAREIRRDLSSAPAASNDLGVKRKRDGRRIASGAAARRFLRVPRVRRGIGAEEEPADCPTSPPRRAPGGATRASGSAGNSKCGRSPPTNSDVARPAQVLRRDRGGDGRRCVAHEVRGLAAS